MPVVVADFFPVRGKKRGGWKERSFLCVCVCVCWRGKEKEEEEEEGNGHYGEFMGAFVRLKINLISAPHFAEPPTPTPPPEEEEEEEEKRRLLDSTTFLANYNLFLSIFVLAQRAL